MRPLILCLGPPRRPFPDHACPSLSICCVFRVCTCRAFVVYGCYSTSSLRLGEASAGLLGAGMGVARRGVTGVWPSCVPPTLGPPGPRFLVCSVFFTLPALVDHCEPLRNERQHPSILRLRRFQRHEWHRCWSTPWSAPDHVSPASLPAAAIKRVCCCQPATPQLGCTLAGRK